MELAIENNTLFEEDNGEQSDYDYNFLNTPWDDRTERSKTCIITLLIGIFVVTLAIIINNFMIFYKGFQNSSLYSSNEIICNLVKVDKYGYVARIHSAKTLELLCVGAMVSSTSILANEVCLKSGAIRLYLGSLTNPHCKKGFSIDVVEPIPHDGVITKNLVLLTSYKKIIECGSIIQIGLRANLKREAFVIGRPSRRGRSLSFQPATLSRIDNSTNVGLSVNNLNKDNVICAEHPSKCPVRAGDLLVQRGRLIGIASTSAHRGEYNQMACFANLSVVYDEIKQMDIEIDFEL